MRFFIAFEIPEQNKHQFFILQKQIKKLFPELRLTDKDKLHLTLAFIGDQLPDIKQDLIDVLEESAVGINSFEITPAYIDGFPNIHNPRVMWTGIKGDIDKIIIIRERIKDGLHRLKLDTDERRFLPHITIGKFNENFEINLEIEEKLQWLMHNTFAPIDITSIKLFESVPDGGFHKHNTLAAIELI